MSKVSNTLYISKIGDKVPIPELKRSLYALFSSYGQILEISAFKNLKRRGQAWITYLKTESAVAAKTALDNYYLFDKPISVQYSKEKSHITMKMNGTFNPYGKKWQTITEDQAAKLAKGPIPLHWFYRMSTSEEEEETEAPSETTIQSSVVTPPSTQIAITPPNHILFVQKLPEEITVEVLDLLFRQYSGYKESRIDKSHSGLAFVEYETINQASWAMSQMNGFEIEDGHQIVIQFAKK